MDIKHNGAAAVPLTREDISALRNGDDWTLHTGRHGVYLRTYVKRYGGGPYVWTRTEQITFPEPGALGDSSRQRTIAATASATGYAYDEIASQAWTWGSTYSALDNAPSCFVSVWRTDVRDTIAASLKPGDAIAFHWTADNNNDLVRNAGLHRDEVTLYVHPAKGAQRAYLIAQETHADNSARMVRRNG